MFVGLFSTTIWLNVTSIIAILYALNLCSKTDFQLLKGNNTYILSILLILLTTIYIGTRPLWCYGDAGLYTQIFNLVQSGIWKSLPGDTTEPIFSVLEYFCIEFTDASGWLFSIATIYIVGMCVAAHRWLPKHLLIAVIFLFTAFSFWGFATNGIRNGMATSIAMIGLSFFNRSKKKMIIGYAILIIASLTHKSCMLIIVASTVSLFFRNTKANVTIWLICIILGLLFQEQFKSLFIGLIDDGRMSKYLNADVDSAVFSTVGFRWDFILYSALPIFIGRYVISKQKIEDEIYPFILHTYIFSNAFWLLINTAAYSNRFAYLSWFLYPIVLVYPFCKFKFMNNQSIILGLMLISMTVFTYVML